MVNWTLIIINKFLNKIWIILMIWRNFSDDAYPIIDRTNSNYIEKVRNHEIEFPQYKNQRFGSFTTRINENRG